MAKVLLQFTGLSGAGKTTLSENVKACLESEGISVELIDGDVYRRTICTDLGYSRADRIENIRRLAKVAKQSGCDVVIVAAINPYEEGRSLLRNCGAELIWLDCNLEALIERDTKGLYKRALNETDPQHRLENLTGVNYPFETPIDPALSLNTQQQSVEENTYLLCSFIRARLNS